MIWPPKKWLSFKKDFPAYLGALFMIMNGDVDPNEIDRQNGEANKTLKANRGDVTTERYIDHLVSKIQRNNKKPVELTTEERNDWAYIFQIKRISTRQSPRILENKRIKESEKETMKCLSEDYIPPNPFMDSIDSKESKTIYEEIQKTRTIKSLVNYLSLVNYFYKITRKTSICKKKIIKGW